MADKLLKLVGLTFWFFFLDKQTLTCMHVSVLGTRVPPLETIHWPQVAFLPICESKIVQEIPRPVCVPDFYPFLRQLLGIC